MAFKNLRSRRAAALCCPVGILGSVWLVGCASGKDITLPTSISKPNEDRHPGLYAGFGRVDITPPPGVPLAGNGFEGRQADGYRQRLYARTLVLEDSQGERVALVVADLPHLSLLLHRKVAGEVLGRTGIGADRLMVAATHTHAGPGNHYGASQYNAQASPLPGLDTRLTRFLVDGIASSVETAVGDLREAVAAWGSREIPAVTRNRSLAAFESNPGRTTADDAVDDTLRLLRIDQCGPGWTRCRPRGAFSVFAIHGTVLPPANTLFDGDVHGVVERAVERAIEDAHPELGREFRSRAFHLFANGAEGDVSPNFSEDSRCASRRRLEGGRWSGGPRASEPAEAWRWIADQPESCLRRARSESRRIGSAIASEAVTLFHDIGRSARLTRDVRVSRAFRTVDLLTAPGLCAPRSGTATFGGAEDARTRLFQWRLLGFDLGMREGGSAARDRPQGCQGHKRVALEPIQGWLIGRRGLPTHAQLAVVRIGKGLIAAVPGEVTTVAAQAMRVAVLRNGPSDAELVTLLGLANGYLQYIATDPEYARQHYEGGSTLYGPRTAEVIVRHLAELAAALRDGIDVAHAPSVVVTPGRRRSYVPSRTQGPDPTSIRREVTWLECSERGVSARWIDVHPGRFRVDLGQVLEIQRREAGRWNRIAWDDVTEISVRALRSLGDRGYEWSASWEPDGPPPPGTYRLLLTGRLGMPPVPDSGAGRTVVCP